MYVPLWCKSNFSFLEGASHPDELIEEAHRLGLPAMALTDRDGVHGMVRAHVKAKELGVKLVPGAQVTVAAPGSALTPSAINAHGGGLHGRDADERDEHDERVPGNRAQRGRTRLASGKPQTSTLVLLAQSRAGWASLTRLVTAGRRRCDKGESVVSWEEVRNHATGLVAVWGGRGSLLAETDCSDGIIASLREAFGERLHAMLTRHRQADEVEVEARVRARARRHDLPVVAASEVLYHSRSRREVQDVLTCIRHGVPVASAGRILRSNDEHELKSFHGMSQLWADDPVAVARTLELAERCQFDLGQLRYRYPSERLPDGSTSAEHLRALTLAGARTRYGDAIPDEVLRQVAVELALIEELDYPGYFLTMVEIVAYCHQHDILCQGRGSAANSAVCFCLGITAIDPVRMGLLFERFLSRERAEPPDIDLDIEHERREEVIQHVYRKYGRDHAAMVCNVIRYRPRSAIRDVGKALGVAETALDRAARMLSTWGEVEPAALEHAGLGVDEATAHGHLARLASTILHFPRHISIHPGGFLLGHEPVHDLVPIENGAMPGRTVIQWDKNDLDDLGLFKVDLLGLGALHQLHLCFDLLHEHRGQQWSMATIPGDDPDTFDMICSGDTIGVFQIESRAQMSMLPRLRPRNFYDLVIEVSIVRPGPIAGGMVHPYLRRRRGIEPVGYPHESLRPVLARTLGVPLFQEQVMRLAVVAADYTPGEADQLRRDMAAWRRSGRIEKHRDRLISRMEKKGIAREFGEKVFEQIRGFGEYGFPESHAASFALIAYATSWLRRHYLPEFTCALLNAQPMGFYSPSTIVGDAQRHELEVRPIDVNASHWDCTLEPVGAAAAWPFAVRMGLRWLKGLAASDGARITGVRPAGGYSSIEEFVRRTRLGDRAHAVLAEAGAFACLPAKADGGSGGARGNRRDALWQVKGFARRQDDTLQLSGEEEVGTRFRELDRLDEIIWDHQRSEHSTRGHPLQPLRRALRQQGLPDAHSVARMRDGQRVSYVGAVICRQRPATAAGVTFMTLEDETGFVNVVVWSPVFARYVALVKTAPLLGVSGRLQVQEGIVHLISETFWVPRLPREVVSTASRDFH
jgi:error-prone DNA polymerase